MKRILTLSLLFLISAAVHAQQTSTATYVHLTSRRWHTFDPANAFDVVSHIVTGNVYESLLAFKSVSQTDAFKPFLASRVPSIENGLISKDHLRYSLPIRRNVRFHDGSLLTAEDVRYSFLRFMLLDSDGGPAALLLRPLLGVSSTRNASGKRLISFQDAARAVTVKGGQVVFTLKKPDSSFLKLLASLPIVTSMAWAAAQKDWDGSENAWISFNARPADQTGLHAKMNGTGPFRLERVEDDELVLARHDGYWRSPSALERVRFKAVPNGGLRLFMLQAGDADSSYLEDSFRPYAKAAKGLRVIDGRPDTDLGEMVFFNFKAAAAGNEMLGSGRLDGAGIPPDFFSDIDVRRGFAWAFDYEQFARAAYGSLARRVRGPFPSSMAPGADGAPYAKDLQKARDAFQNAFGGEVWKKGFVLPVSYSSSNLTRELAAEALRSGLREVNPRFRVELHPLQSQEYYAELESRKLPLFIGGYYSDFPDPHSYAFGLLQSQSYFPKYQSFFDPEIDVLIEKAAAEADPAARRALYQGLSVLAEKTLPHLYTYAAPPLRVCGDWVSGYDSADNTNNLHANNFPYFYSYSKRPRP
ncbi:MAG: hypothetical protein A2X40_11310 [Elusimicrobia bacterium GWC2_65_9]|nr:MAG: hypothetical protein A2X37_06620 [Elusimicrobia bacterium GWA2_66_18]OGR69301.1 MAG: hypothetical protein A2X40_11310 [Elusimicrobia bacterium GWC2_65_9]